MINFCLTILSLLTTYLSLPNEFILYGSPILGSISYVLLFFVVLRMKQSKEAFLLGALYYVGLCLLSSYWLANFGDFAIWTVLGVAIGHLIFYATTIFAVLFIFKKLPSGLSPFMMAMTIALFDYIRSIGPLAFPWNLSAYPFHDLLVLNQIADIGGVFLLGFVVVYPQAIFAHWLHQRFQLVSIGRQKTTLPYLRLTIHAGVLVAVSLVYGVIKLSEPAPPSVALKTIIVQQNEDSFRERNYESVLANLIDLSHKPRQGKLSYEEADLVMWSEASLRYEYEPNKKVYDQVPTSFSLGKFMAEGPALLTGTPKIFGSVEAYNAVELFIDGAPNTQWYAKRQLIPFAESVPGWDIPFIREFVRNEIGLPNGGWTPGKSIKPLGLDIKNEKLELVHINMAAPICFEDAVPTVTRELANQGANVLVNLTNNEWSKTKSAETQHFVAARFRSIENRIPSIRSTNAGVSCVIDRDGRVLASIPMFERSSLGISVDVPTNPPSTLWKSFGDWFVICGAIWFWAIALYLALGSLKRAKK